LRRFSTISASAVEVIRPVPEKILVARSVFWDLSTSSLQEEVPMKNYNSASKLIVLAFAAINLALAATVLAGSGAEYSRSELMGNSGLAIFREADYGYQNGLCIYLDGVPVTTLARGEGFKAIVRSGRHVLRVCNTPSPYGKTNFTERTLHFASGRNYSFTAIWDVQTIQLEDGGYQYHGFYR
jgi:hypothetical protein